MYLKSNACLMGIILIGLLEFIIFLSFGRLYFLKQIVIIRLRRMNGLEHDYHWSLELVEQKKYRDLETNAFPMLSQCRSIIGKALKTVDQHYGNIGLASSVSRKEVRQRSHAL